MANGLDPAMKEPGENREKERGKERWESKEMKTKRVQVNLGAQPK